MAEAAVGSGEQVMERVCKMCRWQQLGSGLQQNSGNEVSAQEKKEIWHYCQERNLIVQLYCLEQRRVFCCFRV